MVYVTSDWHGVPLARIKELLAAAGFSDKDFLYILGDVIDRGEHGIALLKWLMLQPNMELLLGNHEDMLLACDDFFDEMADEGSNALYGDRLRRYTVWKRNGAAPTVRDLLREPSYVRSDMLRYLRGRPASKFISVGGRDFLLVHGGLPGYSPERPLSSYSDEDLIWARPRFDDVYSSDFITVIGHTPTAYYGPEYAGRICRRPTWWDIDTGAAAGRMPMLLCLDTDKETYIEP